MMDTIDTAAVVHRPDLDMVPLVNGQGQQGARQRSMRDYQRQQHTTPQQHHAAERSSAAPVSLELSGDAHPLRVYADYHDAANGPLHVRIVDAKTTQTVGELVVTDEHVGHRVDDYQRLRFRTRAV